MRLRRPGAWPCLLSPLLLALVACDPASPPGPAVTRTDSAGVSIILTAPRDALVVELEETPNWSVGGPDAAGAAQFAGIMSVVVNGDGRIWVADRASQEIRIFDPAGRHLRTLGGRGEGPGEFAWVRILGAIRGDTVVAVDDRTRRTTGYTADGERAREISATGTAVEQGRHLAVFESGAMLGLLPDFRGAGEVTPGSVLADPSELHRWTAENDTTELLAMAPSTEWLWNGQLQLQIPYTTARQVLAVGEELHVTSGRIPRIRMFGAAGLQRVYGLDAPPREVTPEMEEDYRAYVATLSEAARNRRMEVVETFGFPGTAHAYGRLVAGPDGGVWARVLTPDPLAPGAWHVYGPDGVLLGTARTPPRFRVHAVLADGVVGVWLDALDVEHLRKYGFSTREE